MTTYSINSFTTNNTHSFNQFLHTTPTVKAHYFINTLQGFENMFKSRVTSVETYSQHENKLFIYMLINPTDVSSITNRIETEVVFNLKTNKYTVKAIGNGSKKYNRQVKYNAEIIMNGCFDEASKYYQGDTSEAIDMTTDYYCNKLKEVVTSKEETVKLSNELYYEIRHNLLSVSEIETLFNTIINNLITNEELSTSYTVGNRSFTTHSEAVAYCDSVDYDYTMITTIEDTSDQNTSEQPQLELFHLYSNTFNSYNEAYNYALNNRITVTMILSSLHPTMNNERLKQLENEYVFSKHNMSIDNMKEYYNYIESLPNTLDKEERYYKLKSLIQRYEAKQECIRQRKEEDMQLAMQDKETMEYMLSNGLTIEFTESGMQKYNLNDQTIHVWSGGSLSVNEYHDMVMKMYNNHFNEVSV